MDVVLSVLPDVLLVVGLALVITTVALILVGLGVCWAQYWYEHWRDPSRW